MNQIPARSFAMLGAIAILTVLPAVMHGRYTNRWGPAPDLESAAERLQLFPERVGDWQMTSEGSELRPAVIRELQIAGYFQRTYADPTSRQQVQVLLMVGTPGAISRHPPEICYAMRANERLGPPTQVAVTDNQQTSHEFRLLRFQQAEPTGDRFSVCYGFSVDGLWTAPEYPRLQFGGKPWLYKLQVVSGQVEAQEGQLPSDASRFLEAFLPAFRDACVED